MNDPRPSPKMKRNTNSMKTNYQIVDEQTRSTSLKTLKQRLYAINNMLSRYQSRQKQYQQNNEFINKQSKLFDELRANRITIMDPPTKEDTEMFWKPLYENKKEYNKDAAWLQEQKTSVNNITETRKLQTQLNLQHPNFQTGKALDQANLTASGGTNLQHVTLKQLLHLTNGSSN